MQSKKKRLDCGIEGRKEKEKKGEEKKRWGEIIASSPPPEKRMPALFIVPVRHSPHPPKLSAAPGNQGPLAAAGI